MFKDAQWQVRGDYPVRRIHNFADLQIDSRAAQTVSLLAGHVVLGDEIVNHISDGFLGILEEVRSMCGGGEVAALIRDSELPAGWRGKAQFRNVCALH